MIALSVNLGPVIERETGLPVRIAEDPLTAVARGTGAVLEELDLIKRSDILEQSEEEG